MSTVKTVPNQKVIQVHKEKCDKNNLYATININALQQAAQNLDAGPFKLWVYFAKNQNDYTFALSRSAVEQQFGMKKSQYDKAVAELIEKNYLVVLKTNHYIFNEIPVVLKTNHDSSIENIPQSQQEKNTRNITENNIINNTSFKAILIQDTLNTNINFPKYKKKGSIPVKIQQQNQNVFDRYLHKPDEIVSKNWVKENLPIQELVITKDNRFLYNGKLYKMED